MSKDHFEKKGVAGQAGQHHDDAGQATSIISIIGVRFSFCQASGLSVRG